MFAAMTEPILARETPFFRLGSEHLPDPALLLDDHARLAIFGPNVS